ncbi:unnamed protein product [Prunus armeniaca]|uniref:Uncharacterized protein n=1 Tax=Prunus armeniaca TaxID=36596 RepID=A0A6J5UAZ6_PRUAR|nr:unnamed protein product [Prunus armeniaca]
METTIVWNNAATVGAQLFESTRTMEWKDMKIPAAQPQMITKDRSGTENPASDDHQYFSMFVFMLGLAYQREGATKPSALIIDSILHSTQFHVLFAVFLLCRYLFQISLYHVLFPVTLVPLILSIYFYINYEPFLYLEEDIKRIRRESRLLHAISEDAAKVMELTEEINTRACQIWESDHYSVGATIEGLDKTELAWVEQAKSIVRRAKYLVETFEKHRRDSHIISFATIRKNLSQMGELSSETNRVKEEIKNIIEKKVCGINICESLERLRSDIRSLRDRSVEEQEHRWVLNSKGGAASPADLTFSTSEKIKRLIIQDPVLMRDTGEKIKAINLQLLLLHPFLKDIEGLQFESETEKAWVEELEEIINEAHPAIENFSQRPPLLSVAGSWKAWRNLKQNIRCIEVGFSDLLEKKDRYGFRFISRDSSKFVYQPSYRTTAGEFVSPVLDSLRQHLESSVFEVYFHVKWLCNKLEKMPKLLDDAGKIRSRYNSRKAGLEQMKKIVLRAEKSVKKFVKDSDTSKTRDGMKLFHEIDQINRTIDIFLRCIKAYTIELTEESSSVVGLEEDVLAVVSQLTTNNEHHSVISVVGVEGIGKTTLAKKIYNHGVVVDHFPCRAWVSLPHGDSNNKEQLILEGVAKQVLRSLKPEGRQEINQNASSRINEAHNILKAERCLLVIDNISTMVEWNTLKAAFPVTTSSGSRILLTTRNHKLASQVDSDNPPHQLRPLTREESWQLFNQAVHFPPKWKMLAKEILSKYKGSPLAIICLMLGKDENTAQELKRVIQYINQNDTASIRTYTIRCADKLPPHLSHCLSCFKVFPRDFKIPTRRLIAMWIAEGLVDVRDKTTEPYEDVAHVRDKATEYEDVANTYLSELIDRDIVQVVERKVNGRVKTCCLHKDLQEPIRSKSMTLDQRRLADHLNSYDPSFCLIHSDSSDFPDSYKKLISILSFDSGEGYKPGEEIGNFLRKGIAGGFFQLLQVLDLERVFRPELPKTIGKLSKLRYLGLRWTYLESIPTSIGNLLNLQTLDVKHTYVRTLPHSIWKLQELRHLYLSQNYRSKLIRQQGRRSSLKKLQTLWGVFVDKDSPLKDGLDKFTSLRKLGLAFQLEKEDQKALADGILKLKHLQSLRLRSIDELGEPHALALESLSALENLSSLNLFGKLVPSIIPELPKNLTDLTLSASCLQEDPMPKLEKLQNLKSLCFHSKSYTGNKMVCSNWGFEKLVVLKLWMLELEDWDVEGKAMQNLRELEIRSCKKLNAPSGLGHLKTLTELKLTNMPEVFVTTITETMRQVWVGINHPPKIIPINWESEE